jgi:adenosylhomocysteine nucleosidase
VANPPDPHPADHAHPHQVAVLAPMQPELGPLVKAAALRRSGATPAVYRGMVGQVGVAAMMTGMGLANAERVTRELIAVSDCDHVLVVGIAGGLDRSRPIASVVVPETVFDVARDRTWTASPLGSARLEGRLVTTDGLVDDPEVLGDLRDQGFAAVDMETSAVAAVCDELGLPWTAFRGISDHTTDDGVDQDVFGLSRPDGTPDLRAVARLVARHPGRVPGLIRLGRYMQRAVDAAVAQALAALADDPPSP